MQNQHVIDFYQTEMKRNDDKLNAMRLPGGNLAAPIRFRAKQAADKMTREIVRQVAPETL